MQKTVEILLIIGVIANFIKAGDLLLRPHQQKWLQEKCDTLALRLDYTKPIELLSNNEFIRRVTKTLYLITYFCILVILLYPSHQLTSISLRNIVIALLILIPIYGWTSDEKARMNNWTLDKNAVIWRLGETHIKLYSWMIGSSGLKQHLTRPLCVLIFSISLYLAFYSFLWVLGLVASQSIFIKQGDDGEKYNLLSLPLFIVILLGGYILLPSLIIGLVGALVLIVSIIILLSEGILILLRGVIWRIAEYNKGAYSAIILIATALLAGAEYYLKWGQSR